MPDLDKLDIRYSPLGNRVYLGIPDDKRSMWKANSKKKDVTNSFIACVINSYCGKETMIGSNDGKYYLISCSEISKEEHEDWLKNNADTTT